MHRHVVSALAREGAEGAPEPAGDKDYQRNRLARVLSGWFESPAYTDSRGRPLVLPVDGPAPSFAELVRAYSGDIYARIILDELTRVGAVQVLKDGSLRAVSRRYTEGGGDHEALQRLGTVARDLFSTLEHNLAVHESARLFDDSVVAVRLDPEAIPLLRQLLQRRGASFLQDIEGWVSERELADGKPGVRAGVIVQMFVDPDPKPDGEPEES